ncbi:helix-turn-helix domain-containing protein [Silvibacterium sp.]|uniref:helix-turn-helix domain-containing protein n=1 Tax=Silvibacterium sp. TaxID=1964179 RepID=UPI0039E3457C
MNRTGAAYGGQLHRPLTEHPRAEAFLLSRNLERRELFILPASNADIPAERANRVSLQLFADTAPAAELSAVCLHLHAHFVELPNAVPAHPVRRVVTDETAAQLAVGLLEEVTTPLSEEIVRCTVAMLCERLSCLLSHRISEEKKGATLRFQDWQLSALSQVFHQPSNTDITVASVAARCGLSTCHFSRFFKATYGMPLHKYLVRERVKRAQTRLVGTEEPISQIALECGFADQSCFTRRFTTIAGLPPATWRKQARRERSIRLNSAVFAGQTPYALSHATA